VEDRSIGVHPPATAGTANTAEATKPAPGSENQGKPGYYTIRPGDTLIRIALDSGQNWRDIARWNNIDNPNMIEVGQVLRVIPPAGSTEVAVARPVIPGVVVPGSPAAPAASAPRAASSAPAATLPPPANAPPPSAGEDDLAWTWPTTGGATVLAGFDEQRNKGLDIAGKAGDPVLATADGRVVYAGAGLRGYGNLIILKHNNTFLSAYAHNQTLLVKEDQSVRKGQKIAEMGSSDADRVKLHFEIRRQGKPVDPARYLPPK
jgi:lipoprotein NlpD